jgi:DNA-binding NarL/FixJ family response regulator
MTQPEAAPSPSRQETGRARVLIADDHPLVLDGLVKLLKDRFELVGAVTDGQALVDAATRLRPDVVVTDISMPGLSGVEAVARLRGAGSAAKVIFLTMHTDAAVAARLMSTGASGYVLKLAATGELVTAIEQVVSGGTFITPGLERDSPGTGQSRG